MLKPRLPRLPCHTVE